MPGRTVTMAGIPGSNVSIPNDWNGNWRRNDIAIIELPRLAPLGAERFDIYRGNGEVSRAATLVGYGNSGQGTPRPGQPAGFVADNTMGAIAHWAWTLRRSLSVARVGIPNQFPEADDAEVEERLRVRIRAGHEIKLRMTVFSSEPTSLNKQRTKHRSSWYSDGRKE